MVCDFRATQQKRRNWHGGIPWKWKARTFVKEARELLCKLATCFQVAITSRAKEILVLASIIHAGMKLARTYGAHTAPAVCQNET